MRSTSKRAMVMRVGRCRQLTACGALATVASVAALVHPDPVSADPLSDQLVSNAFTDDDWIRVASQERAEVLQMLADHNRGNHERIRTWQGHYIVSLQEPLRKEYVENTPLLRDLDGTPTALTKYSRFVMRFAIDFPLDSIYRSKETTSTRFVRDDTSEEVTTAGRPVDEDSIVTAEHYLHMSPTTVWPNVGVLPQHPEAQNTRAAFREPVENAAGKRLDDLMDPRDFFSSRRRDYTFADMLEVRASALRGERGADDERTIDESLTLYEAQRGDGRWYRIVNKMRPSPSYLVSIWSPAAGYHPIVMVSAKDADGDELIHGMTTQWKSIDGVFVPARVTQFLHRDGLKNRWQRDAVLEECILNEPLDPHQFDYQGLGLEDGELVVDKIENAVYVIKEGEPEKLAAFGQQYVPPLSETARLPSTRALSLIVTVLLIVVLLVLIWRRRTAAGT